MKPVFILFLLLCLVLSGCASFFDGNYISTTPYEDQGGLSEDDNTQIQTYDDLVDSLIRMAERGTKSGILYVSMYYDAERLESDVRRATRSVLETSPIAAYAVDEFTWDIGSKNGQRAVAVNVTYLHERAEILKIRRVNTSEDAARLIYSELNEFSTGVVMYVQNFDDTDYVQLVEKYAFDNPQVVMETPQVVVNTYPRTGTARVIELKFSYQNTRENLRSFKGQVLPIYTSSKYRAASATTEEEKFSQLYSFLMDRGFGEYTIQTSNTPAYSLLWHGAGDSRAFATLYAAICRLSELDCQVITGTRNGEPWYWNLININGSYYHLDLLWSYELSGFHMMLDGEMDGYVWDYSAYPATPVKTEPTTPETIPTETVPIETTSPETQPE